MSTRPRSFWRIFAIPAILFVVSLAGLVLALLIEGWPDAPAALATGCGLLALVPALARRP